MWTASAKAQRTKLTEQKMDFRRRQLVGLHTAGQCDLVNRHLQCQRGRDGMRGTPARLVPIEQQRDAGEVAHQKI